jgi:hypothetical protein
VEDRGRTAGNPAVAMLSCTRQRDGCANGSDCAWSTISVNPAKLHWPSMSLYACHLPPRPPIQVTIRQRSHACSCPQPPRPRIAPLQRSHCSPPLGFHELIRTDIHAGSGVGGTVCYLVALAIQPMQAVLQLLRGATASAASAAAVVPVVCRIRPSTTSPAVPAAAAAEPAAATISATTTATTASAVLGLVVRAPSSSTPRHRV